MPNQLETITSLTPHAVSSSLSLFTSGHNNRRKPRKGIFRTAKGFMAPIVYRIHFRQLAECVRIRNPTHAPKHSIFLKFALLIIFLRIFSNPPRDFYVCMRSLNDIAEFPKTLRGDSHRFIAKSPLTPSLLVIRNRGNHNRVIGCTFSDLPER